MGSPLLDIRGLCTRVQSEAGSFLAVDRVSLEIERGEAVALVGESGSGKSLLALSMIGLLPGPASCVAGEVWFEGRELLGASESQRRAIRGARIGFVFQESAQALNPVIPVGEQLYEVLRLHKGLSRAAARSAAVEALRRVGIPDPIERAKGYPHQLSGGTCQRACIAMALASEPALLIADEPTTALDATVAAQTLQLLRELRAERALSMLLISHDLQAVGAIADRVAVMYAGQIVEQAPARALFAAPLHPYTDALLRCGRVGPDGRLRGIAGSPRRRLGEGEGCRFAPRCARADERCGRQAPEVQESAGRAVRCFNPLPAGEPDSAESA